MSHINPPLAPEARVPSSGAPVESPLHHHEDGHNHPREPLTRTGHAPGASSPTIGRHAPRRTNPPQSRPAARPVVVLPHGCDAQHLAQAGLAHTRSTEPLNGGRSALTFSLCAHESRVGSTYATQSPDALAASLETSLRFECAKAGLPPLPNELHTRCSFRHYGVHRAAGEKWGAYILVAEVPSALLPTIQMHLASPGQPGGLCIMAPDGGDLMLAQIHDLSNESAFPDLTLVHIPFPHACPSLLHSLLAQLPNCKVHWVGALASSEQGGLSLQVAPSESSPAVVSVPSPFAHFLRAEGDIRGHAVALVEGPRDILRAGALDVRPSEGAALGQQR